MGIFAFLLVGLFAGWIASHLVDGRGHGALGDIAIGILGAFIGGFIFELLEINAYGFWGNVAMAAAGSVLLLVVVGLVSGPSRMNLK